MLDLTTTYLKENFEVLSEIPDAQIQYLIDGGEHYTVRQDDFLFTKGEPSDHMSFILNGKIKIYGLQGNQTREFAVIEKGTVTGLLPYSRLKEAGGFGQALEDTEVLSFHRKDMPELIRNNYELTEALVQHMSTRIRQFTTFQQQNEKMMALGKLSAGLAHELNNPASAIVRSSKELRSHLEQMPEGFKKVMSIKMTPEEVDDVNSILFSKLNNPPMNKLSLMQKQELEDDLIDCLEEKGVEDADEVAENLVEFGFTCSDVDLIYDKTSDVHFPPVINWVNNNLTTEKMVREIGEASSRISDLVKSVKNFTHMDQTPDKVKADIHEGLNNTIVMLNHKLKKSGIEIEQDFQENLPKAKVLVSQLNQVWTNLIDNAIDALEKTDDAKLTIETRKDREFVRIKIIDNGPGIPEDIKNSIFDPFFTTKEIGKGTGMGLDVVRQIITQHKGTITVESEPGQTEFEVCLPIN